MDPYNQYAPSPAMSIGASPYPMCPTPSGGTYNMNNYHPTQPAQIPTSSNAMINTPGQNVIPGNYSSYPQTGQYQQQPMNGNMYNNQVNYPVNRNSQTLRPINYPQEYNGYNPATNTYQQIPTTETCGPTTRNCQTQQWMQNHYFDMTCYNQQLPSGAPSVISNASYMSLGGNDNSSQISYQTNITDNGGRMTDVRSMLQMPNYASSVISCAENVDPSQSQVTENDRASMLNNLIYDDEEVRMKALKIMKNLAEKKPLQAKPFISDIMDAINNDSNTSINMERLLKCLCYLSLNTTTIVPIVDSIKDCNLAFIDTLGKRMIKHEIYGSLALAVFRIMLSLSGDIGRIFRNYARKEVFLDKVLEYFDKILYSPSAANQDSTYLSTQRQELRWLLDCYKFLIINNDNMKKCALRKNGITILFNIIKNSEQEDVQFYSLKCISAFIASRSNEYAIEFVKNGVIGEITALLELCTRNERVSTQRVIFESYEILCAVSDAGNITTENAGNTVNFMLNELRKDDLNITKYCTGFLCNLAGKSSEFKMFLTGKDIIRLLIFTIHRCSERLNVEKNNIDIGNINEILENCLIALTNLTSLHIPPSSNGGQYGTPVVQLFNIPGSLQILMNLFGSGTDKNKSRILLILHRLISFNTDNYSRSYDIVEIFLKNVEYVIETIFMKAGLFSKASDKSQKVYKELIKRSISFLRHMCIYYSTVIPKVREIFKMNTLNLLELIDIVNDSQIRNEIIEFSQVLLNRENDI
uniref:BAF250_C domain-containing protein n=1 Tax=Parastrongyloides trichosuri TaxID=131310 RepID=A0A0N4Z2G6_PARTI